MTSLSERASARSHGRIDIPSARCCCCNFPFPPLSLSPSLSSLSLSITSRVNLGEAYSAGRSQLPRHRFSLRNNSSERRVLQPASDSAALSQRREREREKTRARERRTATMRCCRERAGGIRRSVFCEPIA